MNTYISQTAPYHLSALSSKLKDQTALKHKLSVFASHVLFSGVISGWDRFTKRELSGITATAKYSTDAVPVTQPTASRHRRK